MSTSKSSVPIYSTARDGEHWVIVREIPGLTRDEFLRYSMQHQAASVAKELNRWALQEREAATPRPLCDIARDIRAHWPKIYFGAKPYMEAMESLNSIDDMYICESADSIVRHFLANAGTWRGEDARRIKAELKGMLKS